MYKVPFHSIYCGTVSSWVFETFWCLIVLKIYPHAQNDFVR